MEQRSKSAKDSAKRAKKRYPYKKPQPRAPEGGTGGGGGPAKISGARLSALEILLRIEKERAFSSVLLPLYEKKLPSAADRGLCHELTLGVLRRRIYLDHVIGKFVKQEIGKLDPEVRASLRLGAYQLLFLDKIPPFAAINESINLVRRFKKTSAAGLVNAVLRKIGAGDLELEFADGLEKISVETSHPRWLLEHWGRSFGPGEAAELARANNETPRLVFRRTAKSAADTVEILRKLGTEVEESPVVPGAYRVTRAGDMLRVFADEGKIYFQEESSQLVAHAAAGGVPGEKFLDVCAAPGSKTTLISMQNAKGNVQNEAGGVLAAGDKYLHRLRVLRETCRRTGAENVLIAAYDAEVALPFAVETFDCVLVDAPCSGTGTIRHNPEIRYFLEPGHLAELPEKQLQILENASKMVKKGGRLIYSTCSLEISENEAVAGKFLSQNPDFHKLSPELPGRFLTGEGFARTFPHRDETDGFFIAAFGRR